MVKVSNKYLWLILDIIFLHISLLLSIFIRFGRELHEYIFLYTENILLISLIYLLFSTIFHLYDFFWRYVSLKEIAYIGINGLLTISSSTLAIYWYRGYLFPRSIIFLFLFFHLTFVMGNKLLWRLYCERQIGIKRGKKRILIVGAGDAGDVISREILKRSDLGFLVGFVDDDRGKIGKTIHGKKVIGSTKEIGKIIQEKNIESVVIAIPSASGSQIRKIVKQMPNKNIDIKTLPGLYELVDEKISFSKIRKLEIEDILGREPVQLNMGAISKYLKDKVVLVTGAGGSIGSEISRQILPFQPKSLLLLDICENSLYSIFYELRNQWPEMLLIPLLLNITNKAKLKNILGKMKPNVIFHAAAHKHVPILEYYPEEAIWNNIIGTRNLVELANQYHVDRFIMISTDKAINPTSVMGASKRIAEMIVKSYSKKSQTNFAAVRFGNVLDSSGSVIPLFRKQIAQGGPVTVTHKGVRRYFMTISEASQLVIQAGALAESGEVFVLDMGEPIKIYDLATEMIKLMGLEPEKDIDIKVIGLRPGEKLFEELMTKKERSRNSNRTVHEKIFIAQVFEVDQERLTNDISELRKLAFEYNGDKIIKKMQEIIPNYQPSRDDNFLREYKW